MSKRLRRQEEYQRPLPSSELPSTEMTLFLRTKLLLPRPAPALLPRPRLVERLVANVAQPVTLVTANAGSGKTTLVADFVRRHARQCVWYQLDHTDADPFVFLGYVTHGIRQIIPDFGQATLACLKQAAGELSQQPERALDVLLNEVLDRIEQQLIVVFDDYHHLAPQSAVHNLVDRLLAYLPDVMHTIIISREVPPLALARLRTQGQLAIIDRNDLLFTDEETQALFRQVFDLELTPAQLIEYRERTQGWITALQLVRQVAQRRNLGGDPATGTPAKPDLTEILRQSERDIFDYFAEEVFADEPENARRLLLRLSLLDRIELEVCAHLYPEAGCSSILPSLVRRNVFITVASDGRGEEYRLHPLFQSFLRRRLRAELGRAAVASEHRRIADFFLERRGWEQALSHLLAAEDFQRAAAVIAEQGHEWIASGALASLASYTDAIPPTTLDAHPRALAYRAEVMRLRGEYEAAHSLLRRAATLLHDKGDREGEAEALHSLATIARRRSDFATAFSYLDRAVLLTSERSIVRTKCGNTRGLCLVAQSRWTEAEREFRTALQSAEEQQDEHHARLILHNLGLPAMIRGDFGEALRWLRRMLRDDRHAAPIPQEATAHLNLARCYLYRGDLSACEQHLERALDRCQLFNLITSRAETFETYGNLLRERGDLARAAEFYERAARTYGEAGIELVRTELIEEQALLSLQAGDMAAARAMLDHLISTRASLDQEMGIHTATLALGRVRISLGEHVAARAELETALYYFRREGLYYYEAQACLRLAACDQAAGKEVQMIERLRRALELAARYDYEYWLQREVAENPDLFAGPDAAELLPPELREQLSAPGARPETTLTPSAKPSMPTPPLVDLTINMLGSVEILRDPARPFAIDAWTTKRSRDILCFIASRPHCRASKDVIVDTFWAEADSEAVEKNFHPTISHIRKALNSNQLLKQNFLVYRDGDYQLSSDFSYRIDIQEFDRLLMEGEAARRAGQHERCASSYEDAIKLYRGEFMQGCYDAWAEEARAYYREYYLHMLEALVAAALKAEEWSRSLHLAHQVLRDDPFREDVHSMIMRAYAAQGNRAAVKEQYETLRNLVRKELGVEPAAETQKIYRQLFG